MYYEITAEREDRIVFRFTDTQTFTREHRRHYTQQDNLVCICGPVGVYCASHPDCCTVQNEEIKVLLFLPGLSNTEDEYLMHVSWNDWPAVRRALKVTCALIDREASYVL